MYCRDDRIVDFHYPILTCFRKMISDPHPVLVEMMLPVSENYPKCPVMHKIYFVLCLFYLVRQNNCLSYLPLAEHNRFN